jgi:hypothetical protein
MKPSLPFFDLPEAARETGMVTVAVLGAGNIVITTLNFASFAFRPGSYRTGPRGRRGMGIFTAVWVIFLLVGGAVALGIGADALAAGAQGAWQPLVTGAVAMACLPVALLTLRRMWRRV